MIYFKYYYYYYYYYIAFKYKYIETEVKLNCLFLTNFIIFKKYYIVLFNIINF